MKKISLVLVDDHALFRNGLNELLTQRGLNVVGMTGNPAESLELIEKQSPDLVLLDLRMPNMGGLEVLKRIRESMPDQRVIVLTTSIEEVDLLAALEAGAIGYLLKDLEPDIFVEFLKQAHNGETVVAPDLTGLLAKAAVSRKTEPTLAPSNTFKLTPREMDILRYISKGWSNKEIARELGIVDGTVKLHVRAVLKKLNVKSRVQAALMAVSENLIDEESI